MENIKDTDKLFSQFVEKNVNATFRVCFVVFKQKSNT